MCRFWLEVGTCNFFWIYGNFQFFSINAYFFKSNNKHFVLNILCTFLIEWTLKLSTLPLIPYTLLWPRYCSLRIFYIDLSVGMYNLSAQHWPTEYRLWEQLKNITFKYLNPCNHFAFASLLNIYVPWCINNLTLYSDFKISNIIHALRRLVLL